MTDDTTTGPGNRGGSATDRQKIERLHAIARELMGCRSQESVYELTVAAAEQVLEFDICGFDAVEDGWLVPKAVSAEMADVGYRRAPVEEGGLAGEAYRSGRPLVTDDVRESSVADPADEEYRSVLTVPVGDLGVFQAGSREVGAFDRADRELAELLVAHAAEALRRIRSEQALRERQRTIERLHETAAELVACESERAVYEAVVAAAEEVLEFRVCVVLVAPDGADYLVVRAATDDPAAPEVGTTVLEGVGAAWQTYETGRASLLADVRDSPVARPYHESYRAAISVPLGEVGVLQAIAAEPCAFDEDDRDLAELLASQAGEVVSRLRAERHRTEEHDRLAALFRNVPDPAVSVGFDGDRAVVRDVNPAFEAAFGFDAGTAVGADLAELIVPEGDREAAAAANREVKRGESFHREVRRTTADGDLRDFLMHVVPVERAPGNPGAFAIYTDITERKRREQRLGALQESARELMAADDAAEVCEVAVEAAREILGLPVSGVHLLEDGVLAPVAWTAAAADLFGDTPPTYGPEESDVWAAFRADEPRTIESIEPGRFTDADVGAALAVPLGDRGVFLSAGRSPDAFDDQVVDLADVLAATVETALERVEREQVLREREAELQRQNERLAEFASVVSHDLRSPLSVAQGNLELARETGEERYFRKVDQAHDRMHAMIEDLLTLAHQGQVVGETEPVDLERAARRAWQAVDAPTAVLEVEDAGRVEADPDRLVQLLENLFRNAVVHGRVDATVEVGSLAPVEAAAGASAGAPACDASPEPSTGAASGPGPSAGTSAGTTAGDATGAGFYVADDGDGIPPDEREDVLEYGYTTAEDGTGLGLAIVREIAEAHDWSLSVAESAAGGARFEIRT